MSHLTLIINDDPSFPRPPLEPPDVEICLNFEPDTGVLTTKMVKGISEHYVLMPNILLTLPTLDPDSDFTPYHDSLGSENKIFDPGIFIEVQSERLLSQIIFPISFIPKAEWHRYRSSRRMRERPGGKKPRQHETGGGGEVNRGGVDLGVSKQFSLELIVGDSGGVIIREVGGAPEV
ncbi:hypothetical protein Tco_0343784 [Tanacetum coccineum]